MATGTLGTQAKDYPAREQKISFALTPTSLANLSQKVGTIPAGSVIVRATAVTGTAFTAATTLAIGTASGGAQIVAAVSIVAAAVLAMTLLTGTAAAGPVAADTDIWITVNAAPAVGAGVLVVEFAVPGST